MWQHLGQEQDAQITGVFKKTSGSGEIVTDAPMIREHFPIELKPKDLPLSGGERVIATLSSEFGQNRTKARVLGLIWDASQGAEKLSTRILVNAGIPLVHPLLNDKTAKEKAKVPLRSDGRTDLRSIPFLAMDGKDAKDRDDVIHAEEDKSPDNQGGMIVRVAIADVSHYVQVGSQVDRYARHQMFSVYTYDRAAHMLTPILAEDACSLNARVKRYAVTGTFRIDAEGNTISRTFERTLIKPKAALSYDRVDKSLKGNDTFPDDLQRLVENLASAHQLLNKRHNRRKDLAIADNKVIPALAEHGTIEGFTTELNSLSRDIVKKFAVLFNEEFGAELAAHGMPFVGRIQNHPEKEQIQKARLQLEGLGITCPDHNRWTPEDLNNMMEQAGDDRFLLFNVEQVIMPMMMPGEYKWDGCGHYGLGFDDDTPYAPASSPIRRYGDIINHRLMGRLKGWYSGPIIENEDQVNMEAFVEGMNDAESQYGKLQNRSLTSYAIAYLHNKFGGQTVKARIARTSGHNGLKLLIEDCPVMFDIPIADMPDGTYVSSADKSGLYNERLQRHFKRGDTIDVVIDRADPLAGKEGELAFHIETGEPPKSAPKFSRIKPAKGSRGSTASLLTHKMPARIISADTKNGVTFELLPSKKQAVRTGNNDNVYNWSMSAMPNGTAFTTLPENKGIRRYRNRRLKIKAQDFIPGETVHLAVKTTKKGDICEVGLIQPPGPDKPKPKSVSVSSFAELKAAMERNRAETAPEP